MSDKTRWTFIYWVTFSSPELKAVRLSICKVFTFSTSWSTLYVHRYLAMNRNHSNYSLSFRYTLNTTAISWLSICHMCRKICVLMVQRTSLFSNLDKVSQSWFVGVTNSKVRWSHSYTFPIYINTTPICNGLTHQSPMVGVINVCDVTLLWRYS
jgi:hypothetical protein